MAYIIEGDKKYEIQKQTKRIYKMNAYFFSQLFFNLKSYSWLDEVSNETKAVYETFLKCISADVGHLKCDELTGDYIVEQGYNILGVKE